MTMGHGYGDQKIDMWCTGPITEYMDVIKKSQLSLHLEASFCVLAMIRLSLHRWNTSWCGKVPCETEISHYRN